MPLALLTPVVWHDSLRFFTSVACRVAAVCALLLPLAVPVTSAFAQNPAAVSVAARELQIANRVGRMLMPGATPWSLATVGAEDLETALRVAQSVRPRSAEAAQLVEAYPGLSMLVEHESVLDLLRQEIGNRATANTGTSGMTTRLASCLPASATHACSRWANLLLNAAKIGQPETFGYPLMFATAGRFDFFALEAGGQQAAIAALRSALSQHNVHLALDETGASRVTVQSVTQADGTPATRTVYQVDYHAHRYAVIHDPLHKDGAVVVSAPKVVPGEPLKGFRVIPVHEFAAKVEQRQPVEWDSPEYERPTLLNVISRLEVVDGVSLEVKHWMRIKQADEFEIRSVAGAVEPHRELAELIEDGLATAVFPAADPGRPEAEELRDALFQMDEGTRVVPEDEALGHLRSSSNGIQEEIDARYRQLLADGKYVILWGENFSLSWLHQDWGMALSGVVTARGAPAAHRNHDYNKDRPGEYHMDEQPASIVGVSGFDPRSPFVTQMFIASKDARATHRPDRYVVPNTVDPEDPVLSVRPADDRLRELRAAALGDRADDFLVLAPVRPVGRKGLQHALRKIYWLQEQHPELRGKVTLGISHPADDQSDLLRGALEAAASEWGINLVYLHEKLVEADITVDPLTWQHTADAVAYPSTYEGYGNAFLESILPLTPVDDGAVYGNVVFMNRYGVAVDDILSREVTVDGAPITPQVVTFNIPESAEAGPFIEQGTGLFASQADGIPEMDAELREAGNQMGQLFKDKGTAGAPLTGAWADMARNNHAWVLGNNGYGPVGERLTPLFWESVSGGPYNQVGPGVFTITSKP